MFQGFTFLQLCFVILDRLICRIQFHRGVFYAAPSVLISVLHIFSDLTVGPIYLRLSRWIFEIPSLGRGDYPLLLRGLNVLTIA
jgi:hypothetical protein